MDRRRFIFWQGAIETWRGDRSFRQAAAELGVSPSTVWRWEHGLASPKGHVLTAAMAVLARAGIGYVRGEDE